MGTMPKKGKAGRDFEILVAQIEQALVPRGAIVKSPDRIRDKITGGLREVDASIRYSMGTMPILITIECRERSSKPDVRWIEELIQKKEHIGAHLTLAVSAVGFSEPAITMAKHYGIELKRFRDITDDELANWVKRMESFLQCLKGMPLGIEFYQESEIISFDVDVKIIHPCQPEQGLFLFEKLSNRPISLAELYNFAINRMSQSFYDEIYNNPKDSVVLGPLKLAVPGIIYTNKGLVDVDAFSLTAKLKIEQQPMLFRKILEYGKPDAAGHQIIEAGAEFDANHFKVMMIIEPRNHP